jgi:predicted  nucleic acid-binding Zn-ribbon protein
VNLDALPFIEIVAIIILLIVQLRTIPTLVAKRVAETSTAESAAMTARAEATRTEVSSYNELFELIRKRDLEILDLRRSSVDKEIQLRNLTSEIEITKRSFDDYRRIAEEKLHSEQSMRKNAEEERDALRKRVLALENEREDDKRQIRALNDKLYELESQIRSIKEAKADGSK